MSVTRKKLRMEGKRYTKMVTVEKPGFEITRRYYRMLVWRDRHELPGGLFDIERCELKPLVYSG